MSLSGNVKRTKLGLQLGQSGERGPHLGPPWAVVQIGAVHLPHRDDQGPHRDLHLARVGVAGACLITDREGDNLITEWGRAPGEPAGQWTVVRGSGKYAEATGSGTYTIEFLAPQPKPQLRFLLNGEITIP